MRGVALDNGLQMSDFSRDSNNTSPSLAKSVLYSTCPRRFSRTIPERPSAKTHPRSLLPLAAEGAGAEVLHSLEQNLAIIGQELKPVQYSVSQKVCSERLLAKKAALHWKASCVSFPQASNNTRKRVAACKPFFVALLSPMASNRIPQAVTTPHNDLSKACPLLGRSRKSSRTTTWPDVALL
jgi:hypothetical protein